LESDVWLTSDGSAVLDHDGVVGGRLRRSPIGRMERARLPETMISLADLYRECGTAFALSLDIKDPAAMESVVADAAAAGAEALANLWICHPDLALLVGWRQRWPTVNLVHSTRVARLPAGTERHAAELSSHGIQAVNFHYRDWTGGTIALYHRFERLAFGWDMQFERVLDEMLDSGIDGVYSDHVDRMVSAVDRVT
jgi:glycerophosphoryl diester phosphodiesterase